MVGRGGGKKTGQHKIAPGRLQSCAQASWKNMLNKQNADGNNTINPSITNEIALMISKNLDPQRTSYKKATTRPTESPTLMDHIPVAEGLEGNVAVDANAGNEVNNSTQHVQNDQASEGLIPTIDEGLLGKRKRENNFVSRIEVGLQLNEAFVPHPRENIIPNEVPQVNVDERDGTTATSKTRGRGKRGMYKSFVVDKKLKAKGSKLEVTIPKDIERAIGENARHLVNECGRVVRTKAPYNVTTWKVVFEEAGDTMMKEIQDKFQIAQSGDYLRLYIFIVETMQRLYRLSKSRFHDHYKICGQTDNERKKNPPPDLPQDQWDYLVDHFSSPEFKAISERNSKNRKSDKRVKHTTGNLSFPESEDIMTKKNGNVKPSADVIWLFQHTHKNDEGQLEWPNGDTRSKEIHDNLKYLVATAGDSMTQEEILTQVLGQKSGYVRGKGTGVRAYLKGKAQVEQRKILEQQQEKIQQQEQMIKKLQESQLKQLQELEAYKAKQQEEMESFKESVIQQLLARATIDQS